MIDTSAKNFCAGVLIGSLALRRVRIAIEPLLAQSNGPEIDWTWRLILSTIGVSWEQVCWGEACDVAFGRSLADAPQATWCIQADPAAWAHPHEYHLRSVARVNGLSYPVFQHQTSKFSEYRTAAGQWICERDLIFDVFWLATGQEERYLPKSKYGFFDLSGTPYLEDHFLRQAVASSIIRWIESRLGEMGFQSRVPRWCAGKRAAACVSHDVDYPEVIRWLEPLRLLQRRGLRAINLSFEVATSQRDHWHFSDWVKLEQQLQTRSAFYFVPRRGSFIEYVTGTPDPFYDVTSQRFRVLFRFLAEHGVEIGMHASFLAYQSETKFATEKHVLEQASGQRVLGNRHHYWHLNPANPEETLLIHEKVGLVYDSSLFHDHYLGWRRGLAYPFFPFHSTLRREIKTLQIPPAWMDDQLFRLHAFNPGDRLELLSALADTVAQQGGCLMVDVHSYVYDEQLYPGWRQTYREFWQYLLARGDFWFATPAEIALHWIRRYRDLVQASRGLTQGLE